MLPKILIAEPDDFSASALAKLKTWGEVELRSVREGEVADALRSCDVFWFRLGHRITAESLKGPVRCRVIAVPVTGLDHIDLDACAKASIRVVSLRGEVEFLREVRATAELTVALALALIRHIPDAVSSVREGVWDRDQFRGHELYRKTVGIVGMGRLGTITADYFRAFGMRVLGFDTRSDFPERAATRCSNLQELLVQSDFVSVHVSYAPETQRLFSDREFSAMKQGSFFINTSRGGIVDEVALLRALRSGHLGGAALDVVAGEPHVDSSHPLVEFSRESNRLLIVPHIGGNTWESFEKTENFLVDRLGEVLRELGLCEH